MNWDPNYPLPGQRLRQALESLAKTREFMREKERLERERKTITATYRVIDGGKDSHANG